MYVTLANKKLLFLTRALSTNFIIYSIYYSEQFLSFLNILFYQNLNLLDFNLTIFYLIFCKRIFLLIVINRLFPMKTQNR